MSDDEDFGNMRNRGRGGNSSGSSRESSPQRPLKRRFSPSHSDDDDTGIAPIDEDDDSDDDTPPPPTIPREASPAPLLPSGSGVLLRKSLAFGNAPTTVPTYDAAPAANAGKSAYLPGQAPVTTKKSRKKRKTDGPATKKQPKKAQHKQKASFKIAQYSNEATVPPPHPSPARGTQPSTTATGPYNSAFRAGEGEGSQPTAPSQYYRPHTSYQQPPPPQQQIYPPVDPTRHHSPAVQQRYDQPSTSYTYPTAIYPPPSQPAPPALPYGPSTVASVPIRARSSDPAMQTATAAAAAAPFIPPSPMNAGSAFSRPDLHLLARPVQETSTSSHFNPAPQGHNTTSTDLRANAAYNSYQASSREASTAPTAQTQTPVKAYTNHAPPPANFAPSTPHASHQAASPTATKPAPHNVDNTLPAQNFFRHTMSTPVPPPTQPPERPSSTVALSPTVRLSESPAETFYPTDSGYLSEPPDVISRPVSVAPMPQATHSNPSSHPPPPAVDHHTSREHIHQPLPQPTVHTPQPQERLQHVRASPSISSTSHQHTASPAPTRREERHHSRASSHSPPRSPFSVAEDSISSKTTRTPIRRIVTLLIYDQRNAVTDRQLAEFTAYVTQAEDPEDGFWAKSDKILTELQNSPARIDGPAKVYTMRGKFRQILLRVTEGGEDEIVKANINLTCDRTFSLIVEAGHIPGRSIAPPNIPPELLDDLP